MPLYEARYPLLSSIGGVCGPAGCSGEGCHKFHVSAQKTSNWPHFMTAFFGVWCLLLQTCSVPRFNWACTAGRSHLVSGPPRPLVSRHVDANTSHQALITSQNLQTSLLYDMLCYAAGLECRLLSIVFLSPIYSDFVYSLYQSADC